MFFQTCQDDKFFSNVIGTEGAKLAGLEPHAPFSGRLGQERPVQGVVLDGFEDVVGGDVIQRGEVGQGAGDFEDAVVGAGAEVEVGHGLGIRRVDQSGRGGGR